jgi:prevent-host-death family protein
MQIKASTALRNDYLQISQLARTSGEPIFITNKGEADIVILSVEAYEEREKMLAHRASVLEAEAARLAGAETYTTDQIRAMLKEKYKSDK